MSWRDPDWLPTPAKGTGPDAGEWRDCEHCEGTGAKIEPMMMRGKRIPCDHCDGSGCEPLVDPADMGDDSGVDDL